MVSGYFELDVDFVEQLSETTYIDFTELKVRRINGTRKIMGNVTYHISLDNTFTEELLVYLKQGGEYRILPYKVSKKGVCDFHNGDEYFYPEMSAVSDMPLPYPCPFPAVS